MAVTVSATGSAAYNASATTQDFTFTVNPGDTAVQFDLVQDATQSITSVTWDQGGTNQACTLVGSKSCTTAGNGAVYKYAVVNPTSGTKTLRVVQATATGLSAEAQSYTGTVTSSVAAAFTNVLTANGTTIGNVGTAAQSGANGDMYVSAYAGLGTINSVSNTQIYLLSPAGNDAAGNRVASTGTSVSLTMNLSSGTPDWAAVSCDIVAAGAASFVPYNPWPQAAPILAT